MVLLASDFDKSRFFKATDIDGERKLRIKRVTEEEFGSGADKEKKLVVWFTNNDRGLVLNKTNNRTLRGAYGDPVDGWVDRVIVLFSTTTDIRGKMVPALRIRIPPPKQTARSGQAAATKPTVDDELDTIPPPLAKPAVKPSLADDLDDEIDF